MIHIRQKVRRKAFAGIGTVSGRGPPESGLADSSAVGPRGCLKVSDKTRRNVLSSRQDGKTGCVSLQGGTIVGGVIVLVAMEYERLAASDEVFSRISRSGGEPSSKGFETRRPVFRHKSRGGCWIELSTGRNVRRQPCPSQDQRGEKCSNTVHLQDGKVTGG